MADLTKEQKDFFERKEAELEAMFTNPQYSDYTIHYVQNPKKADVIISKQHISFDYLAIGLACLAKEIKNSDKEKIIYVAHKKYPTIENVLLSDILFPPKFGGRSLAPNALMKLLDETSAVLQKYFSDKTYATSMAGFLFYSQVTSVAMGYSEDSTITLEFENFNDTVSAQKLAFENLKKLVISNCLGSLYALIYGDD